jgi:DNA-binding response OmpR family regulator
MTQSNALEGDEVAVPTVEVVRGDRATRVTSRGEAPVRAFVVDASPSVQLISRTLLEAAGFLVTTFFSAEAALRGSIDSQPDVVIIEPRVPRVDALTAMRAMRALHGEITCPVIWCTTVAPTRRDLEEAAQIGLRGVILKPFRLEALVSLVCRVCRTAERERRLVLLAVPADQLTALLLDSEDTERWVRVEAELTGAAERALSLVAVGSDSSEVLQALRASVRVDDVLGAAPGHTLLVLLPEVDEACAQPVASRVAAAVAGVDPEAAVCLVTRRSGEDHLQLMSRAVIEVVLRGARSRR